LILIQFQFLDKKVPDESFPRTNNPAGFESRVEVWMVELQTTMKRNLILFGAVLFGAAAFSGWRLRTIAS